MEVMLTQDYPSLGFVGDRVVVRRGYARNYLLPRGLAVEMGSRNARQLSHKVAGINAHKAKLKAQAEETAKGLSAVTLEFILKFGAQGKSFGSVSIRDIELALAEKGFTFDRRQLKLAEPIKGGGSFEVNVRLHSDVSVMVPIKVTAEKPVAAQPEVESEGGKRRSRRKAAAEDAGSAEEAGTEEAATEHLEESEQQ